VRSQGAVAAVYLVPLLAIVLSLVVATQGIAPATARPRPWRVVRGSPSAAKAIRPRARG
jgi:hypothetical protein